jgi:uncharacterized protein YqeY
MSLVERLKDAQKQAMRAKEKARLSTLRMTLAAIKQIEVDERRDLSDEDVITIITKMVKQRKDAANQYTEAGRPELAESELSEVVVLEEFLPQQLTEEEVAEIIQQAISDSGASGMQDMGKVMAQAKPKLQGRADMGKVSGLVKAQLTA